MATIHPALVIGGFNATGSSSLAKKLSVALDLEYIYAGAIMRQLCIKLGMCAPEQVNSDSFDKIYKEFAQKLLNDPKLNQKLDEEIIQRITTTSTPICVEGRITSALLTQKNIKVALKVWVTADIKDRIKRFKHKNPHTTMSDQQIQELLLTRDRLEIKQYKTQYNLDLTKPHLYNDIVLDTTGLDLEEAYLRLTSIPAFQRAQSTLSQYFGDEYEQIYRFRCLKCGYLYEGNTHLNVCPKCGNADPKFIKYFD